jgi:membrane-associated PAP2 superfamily phosphatase
VITFKRLECVSIAHSLIYFGLLFSWLVLHNPQPQTEILGYTHGVIWIGMALTCLYAARVRIIPLRVAVAVAVLGGIGPFFGSAEFIREQRRRSRAVTEPGGSAEYPR